MFWAGVNEGEFRFAIRRVDPTSPKRFTKYQGENTEWFEPPEFVQDILHKQDNTLIYSEFPLKLKVKNQMVANNQEENLGNLEPKKRIWILERGVVLVEKEDAFVWSINPWKGG